MTSHQTRIKYPSGFTCVLDDTPRNRNAKRKESTWSREFENYRIPKISFSQQLSYKNVKHRHVTHRVNGRERFLDKIVDLSGLPNLARAYHTSSRVPPLVIQPSLDELEENTQY